jgi:hypothetical protein
VAKGGVKAGEAVSDAGLGLWQVAGGRLLQPSLEFLFDSLQTRG